MWFRCFAWFYVMLVSFRWFLQLKCFYLRNAHDNNYIWSLTDLVCLSGATTALHIGKRGEYFFQQKQETREKWTVSKENRPWYTLYILRKITTQKSTVPWEWLAFDQVGYVNPIVLATSPPTTTWAASGVFAGEKWLVEWCLIALQRYLKCLIDS